MARHVLDALQDEPVQLGDVDAIALPVRISASAALPTSSRLGGWQAGPAAVTRAAEPRVLAGPRALVDATLDAAASRLPTSPAHGPSASTPCAPGDARAVPAVLPHHRCGCSRR